MARRPPEDFRVDRPSMAQIASASDAPAVSQRCPCGLPAVPLRRRGALQSWLAAPTAGPGKVPAACHGLPAWEGRIGGWMRETRACSWAHSRFGQQDKQWSLHTAITISSSPAAMLQCCTV